MLFLMKQKTFIGGLIAGFSLSMSAASILLVLLVAEAKKEKIQFKHDAVSRSYATFDSGGWRWKSFDEVCKSKLFSE